MKKYRKKPVEIEAVRWVGPVAATAGVDDVGTIQRWGCRVEPGGGWGSHNYALIIPTLEGDMRCGVGDWIIKGVKGEFYPCKDDIFQATYEEVGQGEAS